MIWLQNVDSRKGQVHLICLGFLTFHWVIKRTGLNDNTRFPSFTHTSHVCTSQRYPWHTYTSHTAHIYACGCASGSARTSKQTWCHQNVQTQRRKSVSDENPRGLVASVPRRHSTPDASNRRRRIGVPLQWPGTTKCDAPQHPAANAEFGGFSSFAGTMRYLDVRLHLFLVGGKTGLSMS